MNNFETKSNFTEKLLMTYINYVAWECWSNTDMEQHDAEESMAIRKILAYDIRMKKNPQTKEDTLWIFKDFHGVIRVQSPTWNPAWKFYQWRH